MIKNAPLQALPEGDYPNSLPPEMKVFKVFSLKLEKQQCFSLITSCPRQKKQSEPAYEKGKSIWPLDPWAKV
jgi:hypothetical protein